MFNNIGDIIDSNKYIWTSNVIDTDNNAIPTNNMVYNAILNSQLLNPLNSVKCVSNDNIIFDEINIVPGVLKINNSNWLVIDDYITIDGDRILLVGQTDLWKNGIYNIYYGINYKTLIRWNDFNTVNSIKANRIVFVTNGNVHSNTFWSCINNVLNIDTDPIIFNKYNTNEFNLSITGDVNNDIITLNSSQGKSVIIPNVSLTTNGLMTKNNLQTLNNSLQKKNVINDNIAIYNNNDIIDSGKKISINNILDNQPNTIPTNLSVYNAISLSQVLIPLGFVNCVSIDNIDFDIVNNQNLIILNTTSITIDGYNVLAGDSVLINGQTDLWQNGIYEVSFTQDCTFVRRFDYNTIEMMKWNRVVTVKYGNINSDTIWLSSSNVNIIGTDIISFVKTNITPTNLTSSVNMDDIIINWWTGTSTTISLLSVLSKALLKINN